MLESTQEQQDIILSLKIYLMEEHEINYTAEQVDALLGRGELERLGMGSRRACYRLPSRVLCIKCYRSEEEIAEGQNPPGVPFKPLSPTVVHEIQRCRFDEKRNTCCQEYRYWKELRQRIPEDLMATFPSTMRQLLLPSRGWCTVEECILNLDGSPAMKFHEAWHRSGTALRARLYSALKALVNNMIRNAVRMYDMPNILALKDPDGTIHLRIADFEPTSRTLIALDNLSPAIVRMKLRRRFARYCKLHDIHETR